MNSALRLLSPIRGYATHQRPGSRLKGALSLDHVRSSPHGSLSCEDKEAQSFRYSSSKDSGFSRSIAPFCVARSALAIAPPELSLADSLAMSLSAIATLPILCVYLMGQFSPVDDLPPVLISISPLQSHIRYLLSTGKTEWDNMEKYIGSM